MRLLAATTFFALSAIGITSGAAVAASDQCDNILVNAANEIDSSIQSNEFYYSAFDKLCKSDGSVNESNASIGYAGFSFGFGQYGSSVSQFCHNFQSVRYSNDNYNRYKKTVSDKALDTYADCRRYEALGLSLSHTLITQAKAQVLLRAGVGRPIEIRGLDTSANVSCVGDDGNGKEVKYEPSTHITNNVSIGIFCTRSSKSNSAASQVFDEGSVAINIAGDKYSFYWPRSELLQENEAAKIQAQISNLGTLVGALSAIKLSNAIEARASWELSNPANPIDVASQCPEGRAVTGLVLTLGGTCNGQCTPDGRPVARFRLICSLPTLTH